MDGKADNPKTGGELRELDRAVRAVARRDTARRFFARSATLGAVALAAGGVAILLFRSLFDLPGERAAWVLLVLPAVAAWVAWRTLQRPLSPSASAARLDVLVGATGLVCAEAELRDPRWADTALARIRTAQTTDAPADAPLVERGHTVRLGGALVFALAALWVPLPEQQTAPTRRLFERQVAVLSEKLDTLVEEVGVEEETQAELERSLERIEEELDTARPESLFEAMDRLAESLEEEAQRAEEALAEAERDLAEAESSAQDGDTDAAMSDLAETLAEMAEQGLFDAQDLEELAGLELGEFGDLDLSALLSDKSLAELGLTSAELGELAAEFSGLFEGKLGKLADAGLLKPGRMPKSASELAKLAELVPHVCDENCEKKPGGT